MKVKTNPAKRVLSILRQGKALPGNPQIRAAWGTLLDVDPESTNEVLIALAQFIKLVEKARIAVLELDAIEKEIYMQPFSKIQQALTQTNLEAGWQNFKKYLDDTTMTSLAFCADTLGLSWEEEVIPDDELLELLEKVQQLIREVLDSSYDIELKQALLRTLRCIEEAILSYHLLGVDGLRTAMESSIGGLFVAREQYRIHSEVDSKSSSVFEKVIDCIAELNKLITFSKGVQQLGTAVVALLAAAN